MKVVILAGGFGTRLAEMTNKIPKPMVPIGGKPILWHIMNYYASYGHNEFILALGYKADIVKDFFLNYASLNSDFTVNLKTGECSWHNHSKLDWKITLVDTGLNTMTGGRIKRLKSYVGEKTFMLTYGDGLANVDIPKLIDFHLTNKKKITVSAVRPLARFGEMKIKDGLVTSFEEKPQTGEGWVNGGYFVLEPSFIELIEDDSTVLEKEPLEYVARNDELAAYKHEDFWQCMDTIRDKEYLEDLWASGKAPWKTQK